MLSRVCSRAWPLVRANSWPEGVVSFTCSTEGLENLSQPCTYLNIATTAFAKHPSPAYLSPPQFDNRFPQCRPEDHQVHAFDCRDKVSVDTHSEDTRMAWFSSYGSNWEIASPLAWHAAAPWAGLLGRIPAIPRSERDLKSSVREVRGYRIPRQPQARPITHFNNVGGVVS